MLKQIADATTALRQYLLQIHWLSHNKDYAGHLLAERLSAPLSDTIDRLKEISLGIGEEESIAYAFNSLTSAAELLSQYPTETDTQKMWISAKNLELKIISLIENATRYYTDNEAFGLQGIVNALGDISEQRIRDVYLINTHLAE